MYSPSPVNAEKLTCLGKLALLVALSSSVAETLAASGQSVASLSLDELMQVEVTTPGKVPEAIRDTPASVYLVSRDDIETFGYRSLTDVFENVPGFYNIDNYTGVSGNFGTRGYWNGRSQNSSVAILVNGIPQMRPDLFATPMEGLNVPVEAIDRIEISQGPNSVVYGNGAFFGAINIITNASYSDDQLTVSSGANDSQQVAARWSEFGEDFSVFFNAGYSTTDGYDHDLLDIVGPERSFLLPLLGVAEAEPTLAGRLEQRTSFAQVSGDWRAFYFDYSLNKADVEAFSGYPAIAEGNDRVSRNSRMTVGADLPLTQDISLDTKLTYFSFHSEENFDALYEGFYGINTRDFQNWELESLLTYDSHEALRFVAGVNLQRLQNFREYTDVPDVGANEEEVVIDKRDMHSVFGQVSYDLSDSLRMVAGYRLEELGAFRRVFSERGNALPGESKGGFSNGTPRASLIYQPSESQVLKVMVGDAVKIPSFNDTTLDSERIRTSEINYTWSKEFLMLSASVFRNSLSDLLIETLQVDQTLAVETDLLGGGKAVAHGVDFLVRSSFSDTLRGELGVTHQDSSSSESPAGVLSYSPEFVVHGKLSYSRDYFSASVLARFVDSMSSFYNSREDVSGLFDDGYFGEPSDEYWVTDLNLRWDRVWEDVFVDLRVSNVFDTEVRYPNNPSNGVLLNRGTLGHGRRLSVKAGIRF